MVKNLMKNKSALHVKGCKCVIMIIISTLELNLDRFRPKAIKGCRLPDLDDGEPCVFVSRETVQHQDGRPHPGPPSVGITETITSTVSIVHLKAQSPSPVPEKEQNV